MGYESDIEKYCLHEEHVRRRGGRLRCRHPVKSGPLGNSAQLFNPKVHILHGHHPLEWVAESGLFLCVGVPCFTAWRRCGAVETHLQDQMATMDGVSVRR